jgi:hypothetical protein
MMMVDRRRTVYNILRELESRRQEMMEMCREGGNTEYKVFETAGRSLHFRVLPDPNTRSAGDVPRFRKGADGIFRKGKCRAHCRKTLRTCIRRRSGLETAESRVFADVMLLECPRYAQIQWKRQRRPQQCCKWRWGWRMCTTRYSEAATGTG